MRGGPRRTPNWTPDEDAVLVDLSAGRMTVTRALVRLPGRSRSRIRARMLALKIPAIPMHADA